MTLIMMLQPRLLLLTMSLVVILLCFLSPTCHSQTTSPQNIETFYPNETLAPSRAPQKPEPPKTPQPPHSPPAHVPAPTPGAASKSSSSSNGKIAKAVAATAASTIVVCGLLFLLLQRFLRARKRKDIAKSNAQGNVFERIDGNVKGLIVDEDGLDVVYWRKLEGKQTKKDLHKEVLHSPKSKEEQEDEDSHEGNQVKKSKSIQETPLLRGKSSTSHIIPEQDEPYRTTRIASAVQANQKPDSPNQSSTPPPPASPSTPSSTSMLAIPKGISPAAPPPPPLPIPARKSPAPPPPPPKAGSLRSSSNQPPAPAEMLATSTSKRGNSSGKGAPESSNDQMTLKPLHWDKVNTTNADHSMVWDKVDRGSFRVDQDLMEALFGYVATNRRSPKGKNPSKDTSAEPMAKVFILDPRKSQNIAIVLKSLAVLRDEILDAVIDGKGLNADTLEKLARISPTEEEQSLILEYRGDPARLAAAESFLYHILKAVPLAFKRLNAMLFRLSYDSEIRDIKESLQILEFGCEELRNQRVFVKLLEAVLKAGNRMNAGTARGNAQAFNLSSLRKLSDVKSTNGKTTLLHFVVGEVVRSEGKRALLNRNGSLSRSSSRSSNNSIENFDNNNAASNDQREREYTTLGLPIVGGISSEFANVKKAALVDYNTLVGSISGLSTKMLEIQEIVSRCRNGEGGHFVAEMDHFIQNANDELKLVKEEQTRVMQLIKKTAEYYQGGASRDTAEHNLQLFGIVKDFMEMVDQACIEIARNMQKRKTHRASSG